MIVGEVQDAAPAAREAELAQPWIELAERVARPGMAARLGRQPAQIADDEPVIPVVADSEQRGLHVIDRLLAGQDRLPEVVRERFCRKQEVTDRDEGPLEARQERGIVGTRGDDHVPSGHVAARRHNAHAARDRLELRSALARIDARACMDCGAPKAPRIGERFQGEAPAVDHAAEVPGAAGELPGLVPADQVHGLAERPPLPDRFPHRLKGLVRMRALEDAPGPRIAIDPVLLDQRSHEQRCIAEAFHGPGAVALSIVPNDEFGIDIEPGVA